MRLRVTSHRDPPMSAGLERHGFNATISTMEHCYFSGSNYSGCSLYFARRSVFGFAYSALYHRTCLSHCPCSHSIFEVAPGHGLQGMTAAFANFTA